MSLKYYILNPAYAFKEIKSEIKWFYQRLTRGFDDGETYSMDWTIAKFVLPRLKRFQQLNNGFPDGTTEHQWECHLKDMIYSMEVHAKGIWDADEKTDWERVKRGQVLFGKHFSDLWW